MAADGADDLVRFDPNRERFYTATCGTEPCWSELIGRSLDGRPVYWWHSIEALDNDHDARPLPSTITPTGRPA